MLDWDSIHSIFLDMDGTLLDLHYDNYFWQIYVPQRYAKKHHISEQQALNILTPKFKELEGSLDWYCVDFWTKELDLDIVLLKEEVNHLIQVHPHVIEFLTSVRHLHKRVVLVTNAHDKSIHIKMEKTALRGYFDVVISSHQFGIPKEKIEFWQHLQKVEAFDPAHTVLIDDNLTVLSSARQYGIKYLRAVCQPDSRQGINGTGAFLAIHSFHDILPVKE